MPLLTPDLPPKFFLPSKPALQRTGEPWEIEAHAKMIELGLPRGVRSSVVKELKKLREGLVEPALIKPTMDALARFSRRPEIAMPGIFAGCAPLAIPPLSSSYITSNQQTVPGSISNPTFSSVSVGTADPKRYILVGIAAISNANGPQTISACTVGGSGATILTQRTPADQGGSYNDVTGFALIAFPTGTTANIQVTFSGNMATWGIGVWRLIDLFSTSLVASANLSANPLSGNINVSAGGSAFGVALAGVITGWTWTGITERYDADQNSSGNFHSGASLDFANAQTPLAVTANCGTGNGPVGTFISLR